MKRSTSVIKIFALLAIMAPIAMVGCKGRGHGLSSHKIEKMEKRIASKLELNEQQKSKLSEVTAEVKKVLAEKQGTRSKDLDFAKDQIKSDKLNVAEIKEFLLSKQDDHVAVFDRVAPKLSEFHATLSVEQKTKLMEFLDKMKERFPSEK